MCVHMHYMNSYFPTYYIHHARNKIMKMINICFVHCRRHAAVHACLHASELHFWRQSFSVFLYCIFIPSGCGHLLCNETSCSFCALSAPLPIYKRVVGTSRAVHSKIKSLRLSLLTGSNNDHCNKNKSINTLDE